MTDRPVVLITGASSGIGRATALRFVAGGFRVFGTARRRDAVEDAGPGVEALALDVDDASSIDAAVAETLDRAGKIDVLVNNAGWGQMGPLLELPAPALRSQLETNVVGLLEMTKRVALGPAGMVARRSGRIVNVGSVVGWVATPFGGAYAASKFAVRALSDVLRVELAPFGIEVVQVEPGPIRSGFAERAERNLGAVAANLQLYAPFREAIVRRARASQDGAAPAAVCADVIFRAATAKRPRTRYGVTWRARALRVARALLSDRLLDARLASRFGLDRRV